MRPPKATAQVTWDQPPNPRGDHETTPAVTSATSRFAHSSNILILQETTDAQKGQVDVQDHMANKGGPQFSLLVHPLHTMTYIRTLGQKPLAKRSRKCRPKVIFQIHISKIRTKHGARSESMGSPPETY